MTPEEQVQEYLFIHLAELPGVDFISIGYNYGKDQDGKEVDISIYINEPDEEELIPSGQCRFECVKKTLIISVVVLHSQRKDGNNIKLSIDQARGISTDIATRVKKLLNQTSLENITSLISKKSETGEDATPAKLTVTNLFYTINYFRSIQ